MSKEAVRLVEFGVSKEAMRLVEFGVGKETLVKKNKVQRESTGFG